MKNSNQGMEKYKQDAKNFAGHLMADAEVLGDKARDGVNQLSHKAEQGLHAMKKGAGVAIEKTQEGLNALEQKMTH